MYNNLKKLYNILVISLLFIYTSVTAAGTTYMTFMPNRFVNTKYGNKCMYYN